MTRPHLPLNPEQLQAVQFCAYMLGEGFFEVYEEELARLKISFGLKKGVKMKAYYATEAIFKQSVPRPAGKEHRFSDWEGFRFALCEYYKRHPKLTAPVRFT